MGRAVPLLELSFLYCYKFRTLRSVCVCLSVCLCAGHMGELCIKPLTRVGPRNHVFDGVHVLPNFIVIVASCHPCWVRIHKFYRICIFWVSHATQSPTELKFHSYIVMDLMQPTCLQNMTNLLPSQRYDWGLGYPEFKMGHLTRPLPFQGWFIVHGLELATINLLTKSEFTNYNDYEDMKDDAKCTKWGGLEYLGVTQGHWQ